MGFVVRRFCFDWHVDHWIDHGLASPTVHVLGRNALARWSVGSLPPLPRVMVARLLVTTVRGNHGETPGLPIHGRMVHIDAVPAAAILRQRTGRILL